MIRLATLDDVPAMVDIGRALVEESPRYSQGTFCGEKVARMLTAWIEYDDALVLIAEHDGQVIGVLAAVIDSEWFSTDRVVQEMVLTVVPHKRGSVYADALIAGMDAWAEAKQARSSQAGSSTGIKPELTAKLYGKHGYKLAAIGVEKVFN